MYCLETEVFLRCQITDILSENKNKTQCIARLCFLSLAQSRDDSKGAAGSSFQNKMKIMRLKFEHCAASEHHELPRNHREAEDFTIFEKASPG